MKNKLIQGILCECSATVTEEHEDIIMSGVLICPDCGKVHDKQDMEELVAVNPELNGHVY